MKIRKINFLVSLLVTALFATAVFAQQRTITGVLTPTVEAGGWLVVEQGEKFLILNAAKFSREGWFQAGTRVTARGELKRDAITIYQEGVPFEASTMVPVQSDSARRRLTLVTVSGDARISAPPDTASVTISVVTQDPTAVEAQQKNATQTAAVIAAVKMAAGPAAEIRTSGYALIPQRVYRQNEPPSITGYEARNGVSVTLSDLTRVGPVIDAAAKAGANNIDGVSFTIRNDREPRSRALAESTRAALAKAETLARTLGGRVVRIVSVNEGGTTPRPVMYAQQDSYARTTAETPIETGTLDISSSVQLTAEIELPS